MRSGTLMGARSAAWYGGGAKEGGRDMAIVEIASVPDEASTAKDAVPIRIEVADSPAEESTAFYSDVDTRGFLRPVTKVVAKTADQIYDEAIEMACEAAAQTTQRLAAMDRGDVPDEFEVTFGINIGLGGDTKIVNINSGAQVQVRMQWNRRSDG